MHFACSSQRLMSLLLHNPHRSLVMGRYPSYSIILCFRSSVANTHSSYSSYTYKYSCVYIGLSKKFTMIVDVNSRCVATGNVLCCGSTIFFSTYSIRAAYCSRAAPAGTILHWGVRFCCIDILLCEIKLIVQKLKACEPPGTRWHSSVARQLQASSPTGSSYFIGLSLHFSRSKVRQ